MSPAPPRFNLGHSWPCITPARHTFCISPKRWRKSCVAPALPDRKSVVEGKGGEPGRHTRCLSDWSSDVCSSDLPGPFMAVYYASKAYVLHFTEALAEELRGTGVTVTCLCPGPVKTNFQNRAHIGDTRLMTSPMLVDVREVARVAYEGMKQGKRVVIPGWKNRFGVQMLRLSPREMVTKVVRKIQESK